ncbi:MAG: aldehyde dehydrogenase family protein, partial [Puniceicoccaceae bacterium]|nr:aldehyde dehydrogenase family protein [Puniceicoccaceae bacterium]
MNIQNFIDNEFVDGVGTIDVFNPVTGEKVSQVASASAEDVNRALHAAQTASNTYGQLSINARKALIDELIIKLKGDEASIVDLLIQETGKTYDVASY